MGYKLELRKGIKSPIRTILGPDPWNTIEVVPIGHQIEIVEEKLSNGAMLVDFLNAPRTKAGVLAFLKTWGTPLRPGNGRIDLRDFLQSQADIFQWQKKAVEFRNRGTKSGERATARRAELISWVQARWISNLKADLVEKNSRDMPGIALVATDLLQFMRLSIFHSAFVAQLAVPCKACGRFVRVTPLGRLNSICSAVCRQRLSRAKKGKRQA